MAKLTCVTLDITCHVGVVSLAMRNIVGQKFNMFVLVKYFLWTLMILPQLLMILHNQGKLMFSSFVFKNTWRTETQTPRKIRDNHPPSVFDVNFKPVY